MKILIIATPRSGSTKLLYTLANILKYNISLEPFNNEYANTTLDDFQNQLNDNMVVKSLFLHYPSDTNNRFDFYKDFIKNFDRVIVLTRQDIMKCYESWNHCMINCKDNRWHNKYIYKETEFNEEYYNTIKEYISQIISFANINKLNITYYEDLYSGNSNITKPIVDSWNLDISYDSIKDEINPKNKYRIYIDTKSLI